MLNGQIALHSLRIDQALEDLQQAVDLAPDSLAAKAMLAAAHLYAGRADHYAATLASVLEQIGDQPPETALDCFCVGTALVAGHPDTSKAVALLDRAWRELPSGATLLQLALAEAFHAANTGSWEVANRALAHCELAGELLGVAHPIVRTARLNAFNFAIRLCPETERAGLLRAGADAAAALDETHDPIGHMQRAFFFQVSTNDHAALKEWQLAIEHGGAGLFGCLYAAAMFGANRSAEALEFMNGLDRSPDSLESAAYACLLLDLNRSEEADHIYEQLVDGPGDTGVLVTTLPLLAGDVDQVRLHSRRVLDSLNPSHPMYCALSFLSGQDSAEDFVDAAARSRNARCTAHYFIALSYLARGERRAAGEHFKNCLNTGAHYLPTFQWGRAFLARMENDPSWPPWIPPKPQ